MRTGTPVIVELFSSEGCSSCPPADAYASMLDRTQPIDGVTAIVLEEHVDYWDDLGWKDPFARPAFGARQRQYASRLEDSRVYTPEIVIDGNVSAPNGEDDARKKMVQSARNPKAHVILARDDARLTIDVTDVPPLPAGEIADVWLALTESGKETRVERGENGGRTLAHAPIVRSMRRVGRADGGALHTITMIESDASWAPRAMRTVVFVQRPNGGPIVGAAIL